MNLFESLRNGARSAFCALSAPLPTLFSIGGGIYQGLGGEQQGEDLLDSADLVRAARNVACNVPPVAGGSDALVPFTGGQCPGVMYQFNWFPSPVPPFDGVQRLSQAGPGPLEFVSFPEPNGGASAFVRASNGVVMASAGTGDASVTAVNLNITNMVRLDGQPDDCGNPSPDIPPYNQDDWTTPQPVTYDDNDGNSLTINPTFRFSPGGPDGNGGLTVPFDVTFEDGSQMFGDFNLTTGDINIGIGNSGGEGTGGGAREIQPGEDIQEGNGNIVGVRVIASKTGSNAKGTDLLQPGGNGTVWFPRIGNIAFGYDTQSGIAWSEDIPVKGENYIIWAKVVADYVRGTPENGWSFQLLPRVVSGKVSYPSL